MSSVLAMAVPGFLALIAIDLGVGLLQRRRDYRVTDSLSDLCCGLGDQAIGAVIAGLVSFPYQWLYENARLIDLPQQGWLTFAVAFIGKDIGYYFLHRFGHRTALGWSTHGVHHQSEDYNLAVALRQSWFMGVYAWVFYVPLAVLGVPLASYALASALNLLYQFWIHTQAIQRLGPLEWVLNTPSHHRVHHGCDPKYLDKNYAGVFIVWDRLFGTFQPEEERPTYGVLQPIRTWSAPAANLGPLWRLLTQSLSMPGLWNKLQAWFRPPGWTPAMGEPPHPVPGPGRGYNQAPSRATRAWAVLQFVPTVPAVMTLMAAPAHPWGPSQVLELGALAAFVLSTTATIGALLDGRRWAWTAEIARLALTGVALTVFI